MVGMAKDNFPAVPAFPHPLVKIPAKILSSLIAKTAFAISMEESRYTLNGALLILKPDTIAMVATDGHRLALAETDHSFAGLSNEARTLVPKKAMNEIQRLAGEAGEERPNRICARRQPSIFSAWIRSLLISRILTGQFPNYEAVLPRDNNKNIVLERGEFNDAVRRVSQLADQRSHAVKFSVNSGRRRTLRLEPRIWRGQRNTSKRNTKASPSPSALTASTCSIFWRRGRRPHQRRAERRAVRGPSASARRRTISVPLRHHADAHLTVCRVATDAIHIFGRRYWNCAPCAIHLRWLARLTML